MFRYAAWRSRVATMLMGERTFAAAARRGRLRRMRTIRLSVMGTCALLMCCSPAWAAKSKSCPRSTAVEVPYGLSAYTVILSVKGISCKTALRAVRPGTASVRTDVFTPGAKFRLGKWKCAVTARLDEVEQSRARCTRRGRSFRLAYGA